MTPDDSPQQLTWFGVVLNTVRITPQSYRASDPNPALAVYGPGPQGTHCGTCGHFERHQHGAKTYGKCTWRGVSHGPGTDHYATWAACGRYHTAEGDNT